MTASADAFWKHKTLEQLDRQEWESLCDGCGLCCLQKLEDEEDNSVYYTRIACKLLDLKTCQCKDYPIRLKLVPDCIKLTPGQADQFKWLPPTCGYRLVSEGKDLPSWHHLVCGDRQE
ncbi:MAG: YcgN family cysteine cluster protein, partial [Pseudomonas sp.]